MNMVMERRKICFDPVDSVVTADPTLNLMTVGWPRIMVAEEASISPHRFGFNPLPRPVFLPGTTTEQIPLTFRVDSTKDFFVDWVTLQLWQVTGVAPNRQLTFINPFAPGGTVAALVFLSIFDGGGERKMEMDVSHWATFAGNGRNPHKLPLPAILNAGNTYSVKVTNQSGLDLAISMQLHGRAIRLQASRDGHPVPDFSNERSRLIRKAEEVGGYKLHSIRPDRLGNRRGAGDAHYLTVNEPNGHVDITTAASYDAPFLTTPFIIRVDANSHYFVRSILGHQRGLPLPSSGFIEGMTAPIFCHIYDQWNRYWISQAPIPMAALCGDGRFPQELPVDWAWRRGSNISIQFQSFSASSFRVAATVAGYYKDIGP